jgi:membrane protein
MDLDVAPMTPPDPPPPHWSPGPVLRARDFVSRVVSKAEEDRIFLLAGSITFNVLVAFVPLLLLAAGIAGFILSARVGDPAGLIVELILEAVPAVGGDIDLVVGVRGFVEALLAERRGFSLLGAVIFIWFSTRLMGTLRSVLGDVFDISQDRGILAGKLFDAVLVILAGVLVSVNLGLTVVLEAIRAFGVDLLGVQGALAQLSRAVLARTLAFGSVWALFLILYRYAPARRPPWRTVLVSATFTALVFEATKLAFSWYVTSVADYGSTYGNLATVAVLFIWIHYGAIVFILGGEVGQVYTMRRAWRVQNRTLVNGPRLPLLILLSGALAAGLVVPGTGVAQEFNGGFADGGDGGILFQSRTLERNVELPGPLLDHDGPYVVVHLAENRVFLVDNTRSVWSAPAGTGTGFRLAGAGQRWTFTTPQGLFRVLRKEKDPMWEAPDWYYVEKGLTPPALNSPSRRMAGVMGTTAIYLGDGIAIHGTNSPQLLLDPDPERRRVSHGCIRLTNEAARELYHLVDVGTPVLIY